MRSERLSSSVADVFMWAVWKYPLSLASITKTRLALIVLRRFEPGLNRPWMDCDVGRLDVLAWAVWWNECAFSLWQDAQASSATRPARPATRKRRNRSTRPHTREGPASP